MNLVKRIERTDAVSLFLPTLAGNLVKRIERISKKQILETALFRLNLVKRIESPLRHVFSADPAYAVVESR